MKRHSARLDLTRFSRKSITYDEGTSRLLHRSAAGTAVALNKHQPLIHSRWRNLTWPI
jgi:hypothetical protein